MGFGFRAQTAEISGQFFGVQRPGVIRRYSDEFLGVGQQGGVHGAAVLVCHDAGENDKLLVGQIILNVFLQGFHALGIVAAVYNEQRVGGKYLETPRPLGCGQTVIHGLGGDVPALTLENGQGCQNDRGIVQLMGAQKTQFQPLKGTKIKGLPTQIGTYRHDFFALGYQQQDLFLVTLLLNDFLYRLGGGIEDTAAAGFYDAGLGRGDLLQGTAEILRVVKTDVGNNGGFGSGDDIGGVQCAAHAGFQHDNVGVLPLKVLKSNGGDQLKFRRRFGHGLRIGTDKFRARSQVLIGDFRAVYLHSFVEAEDVR